MMKCKKCGSTNVIEGYEMCLVHAELSGQCALTFFHESKAEAFVRNENQVWASIMLVPLEDTYTAEKCLDRRGLTIDEYPYQRKPLPPLVLGEYGEHMIDVLGIDKSLLEGTAPLAMGSGNCTRPSDDFWNMDSPLIYDAHFADDSCND